MNFAIPVLLVVIAGAAVALQPGFNGQLSQYLGSPLRAALVNFLAGATTIGVLLSLMAFRAGGPSMRPLGEVPVHLWIAGGALGAMFVTTATWSAPKIGTGVFFAVLIAAQLAAALVIDHFGLVGMEPKPANLMRVGGVVLLVLGAILVARG